MSFKHPYTYNVMSSGASTNTLIHVIQNIAEMHKPFATADANINISTVYNDMLAAKGLKKEMKFSTKFLWLQSLKGLSKFEQFKI